MANYVCTLLNFVLLFSLAVAEIPPYLQVCGRQNPQIEDCIKESIVKLRPKLKTGVPELDIPSFEPLYVDEILLSTLDTFRAVATNVQLWGLTDFVIKHLKVDQTNQKLDIELLIPRAQLKADYDVKARILVPVSEKGPINFVSENVDAKASLKYQTVEKQGRTLIYFPTITTKITLRDYEAIFLPGSEDNPLAQAVNSVLSNSRKELIENVTPNLEKAISKKMLQVANSICKHFTYDELFPNRI